MKVKANVSRACGINNYSITDFCNNIDEVDENMAQKVEAFNEELTLYLTPRQRCDRLGRYLQLRMWLHIIVTAIIAGVIGASLDYGGGQLFGLRLAWSKNYNDTIYLKFLMYWITMLLYVLLSTSILGMLAPTAAGSGVPPLKSVLGGVHIYKFLHWKILIAKYFGILFTLASGVGSGKEGPMIHISAMASWNLGNIGIFKEGVKDPYTRRMLLNASVACGVCSTFGAPYGAMIFAIELCSTVFLVSNMWKLFVSATVVKTVYDLGHFYGYTTNIVSNFYYDDSQAWQNLPHFIMLGVICGWMASLWIFCFSQFLQFKGQLPFTFVKNRYFYCFMMSIVITVLQFWRTTSWKGNKGLLISLWTHRDLDESDPMTFPVNHVWSELLLTILFRWLMIMCFATMPIPCGIALPSITQGAFIGRFYGEMLRWFWPQVQPQAFSIVGAAAFGGCMTRCTSISLLITELTGQCHLIIGIITGNMFAYAIANLFTMSAFNTAMTIGKMPYLPFMFYSKLYKKKVREYMHECNDAIEDKQSIADVLSFYAERKLYTNDEFIPIVTDKESLKIVGSVRSWNNLEYIVALSKALEDEIADGNCDELMEEFCDKLTKFAVEDREAEKRSFKRMPGRLREFIEEIREHEASLDFSGGGLSNVSCGHQDSALKDKWTEAFAMCHIRMQEDVAGVALEDSEVKVVDEYFLFAYLVLARMHVDWENPILKFNSYPICVDGATKLVKVHFLFQMLGVGAIYIADRGKYQGKITLEAFLNLRYTAQKYL